MRAAMLLALPALICALPPAQAQSGAHGDSPVPAGGWHGARLPASFFVGNRAALMAKLRAMGPGTVAVIKSMPQQSRNGDGEHAYRQDSDFYYLTGVEEENAVALLDADAEKPYTLFVQHRDPRAETWTGTRLGVEGARAKGADQAFDFPDGDKVLDEAMKRAKRIVLVDNFDEDFRRRVLDIAYPNGFMGWRGKYEKTLVDGRPILGEMRVVKQPAEIDMIRKAVEVSLDGHFAAMRGSAAFTNEGQVAGAFEGTVRSLGARFLGYDTIAGAGNDGCTLHYPFADQPIAKGDLILMDAGAELGFYSADVTRTWPANGHFSPEQRALYDIVLKAQDAGIAACRVGEPHIGTMKACSRIISDGLVDLGILKGDKEEVYKKREWSRFLPHGVSHWMGLDVHDTGDYGAPDPIYRRGGTRPFEAGMVLTVEPGIYIPKGAEGVDAKWQGIGIRIEDDILVTKEGPVNLSGRLPRKAEELEQVVQDGAKKRR